jgi:2-desacetyl-2-hydroxyethyl bacteriochlorophyllide A dehydrogenase
LKLTLPDSYTTGVLWAVFWTTANQIIFDYFDDRAMKAIVYREFGPPDVLELEDVEKPEPGAGELLVKVHAASVTYSDWSYVRGKPLLVRLIDAGLFRPKHPIPGDDIAGQVEAVGHSVDQFQPGDRVFGDVSGFGRGGFAEYAIAPAKALAHMPVNLAYEQAAAVPSAAFVALQGLRDKGEIQAGEQVLIVGASGGIGVFAVQIAKAYGAKVTAVCSSRNLERMHSLGVDHTIDYTQEDFTRNGQSYDLIFAIVGDHSIFNYRQALSSTGRLVVSGGSGTQFFQAMLLGPLFSSADGKQMGAMYMQPNQADLLFVKELIEAGKISPVIDRVFPLAEAAEAVRYYGRGHAQGKVVISIQ